MNRLRALFLTTTLLALPGWSAAEDLVMNGDLVVNGGFDGDIDGWTLIGFGTEEWDPLDWQGNPSSGSIRITNTRQSANQFTASAQCIPLSPSGTYEVGTHVRFPSGQLDTGFGFTAVAWFDNPNCVAPSIAVSNTPLIPSTTLDTWVESFTAGLVAPAGTVAVGVGPGIIKTQASGSLAGLFDRVHFGPTGSTPVTLRDFRVE